MAKPRGAPPRRCDARLLREMNRVVRGFQYARGKQRLEALRRYVAAITEFSNCVTMELPSRPRRKTMLRYRKRNGKVNSISGNRRVHSELVSYFGAAGTHRILNSVSAGSRPTLPAVKSVLDVFLGKVAASRLMDRIIDSARD